MLRTLPDNPRILVIRMSSLGDIILTAPVFRNLKARWPGARVDLLVKPQFRAAAAGSAFIDNVIPFTGLLGAANAVNAAGYDLVLDLHATLRSRLLCLLADAPLKLRYHKASLDRRLFVDFRIPSPSLEKHTLDRYLEPLERLGVPVVHRGPELGDWRPASAGASLPGPRRLCVLQSAFLGDCVLTLPLLKKLRETYPSAAITVVTRPETAQIFSASGLATEVLEDRKKTAGSKLAEFSRLRGELASRRFDAAVIPHRSLRSALLAWRAGIPVRIGFSTSAGAFLLTHKVPFSWLLHDAERNLALLSPLTRDLAAVFPGIRQDPEAAAGLSIPPGVRAGVNAGSAWPTKRWPAEKWARLIRRLHEETGEKVLMVGGPGELDWNAAIEKMAGPERCLNLCGKTSMPALMEALRPLKVFVSNDSGPMHIAAALGVPAVGIFGPTTRELGFFPYGPGNSVVQTELECRPCALHGSRSCPRGHFLCMNLLTVDEVFSAAREKLSAKAEKGH